jgi:hypothetical protein
MNTHKTVAILRRREIHRRHRLHRAQISLAN